MPDLVEWLETAISEWERAAELATPGPWVTDNLCFIEAGETGAAKFVAIAADVYADGSSEPILQADAEHIALNNPDAVLRRCAADRKILELWAAVRESSALHADAHSVMREVIRSLAEGYGYPEGAVHG